MRRAPSGKRIGVARATRGLSGAEAFADRASTAPRCRWQRIGDLLASEPLDAGYGKRAQKRASSGKFRLVEAPALVEERRQLLLARVRAEGRVVAAVAAQDFGVSEDTIRRDLRELAAEDLVARVRGGALRAATPTPSFARRRQQPDAVKEALAGVAALRLASSPVIALDAGSTNVEIARRLPPDCEAVVVTNCPAVAAVLVEHPSAEPVILGGPIDKEIGGAIGGGAIEGLRGYRLDVAVLGVCALHADAGVTTARAHEVEFKRALIARSGEVLAVVGAEKLSTASPFVVAGLSDVTSLVTERLVSDEELSPFRDMGIEIVRA